MTNKVAESFANKAWEGLCEAILMFGPYICTDKGANEVIKVHDLADQIKSMSVVNAKESLVLLYKKSK